MSEGDLDQLDREDAPQVYEGKPVVTSADLSVDIMISSRISSRIHSPVYRALLLVGFLSIASPFLRAQNRDEWSAFSALNVAQSIAFASDGTLWVATTGGVVGYNPVTDSTQVFRTTEGLLSLNCSAIAIDSVTGDMSVGGAEAAARLP